MRETEKDYEILERVGQGTYGAVFKARNRRTGELFALKKIRLEAGEDTLPAAALREIGVLKALQHPNVVRLLRVSFSPAKRKLYLFFEYAEADLREFIATQPLSLGLICSFSQQLLQGLEYIHTHRVMHRDIKTQNLLVQSATGELKIADFGLARPFTLPVGRLSPEIQSLWYRAPEILLGDEHYSLAVDVWSAGCVVAEMLLRRPLFTASSEIQMIFDIFSLLGSPAPDSPLAAMPHFTPLLPRFRPKPAFFAEIAGPESHLGHLMGRLLDTNPDTRITAHEALKLPLFTHP